MVKSINLSDIAQMPLQQRLQLVEAIWDSIAELPEAVPIPEWHRSELDKRLRNYRDQPESVTPWSEIRKQFL